MSATRSMTAPGSNWFVRTLKILASQTFAYLTPGRESKITAQCPHWVMTDKTRSEHKRSALGCITTS
jgi:hypothetical protein